MKRTTRFLLFFAALPLRAETIELLPVKDNTLYEPEVIDPQNPSVNFSNGVGDYLFAGRTSTGANGKTRRALLKFDLSEIPTNATITSASLRLYLSNTKLAPDAKIVDVELRRLGADWGEGTSDAPVQEGGGATVTDGDATWHYRVFATEEWTAPGGDYAPLPTAIEAVGDKFRFYQWEGPGLVEDLQSWLDAPESNHGWIVISDESEIETAKRFDSRESFNFSADNTPTKPLLKISYETEPPAPQPRLINVSTRAQVESGDNILIAGLVIGGNSPRRVLIRGIGPSLGPLGVSNPLAQPTLALFRDQTLLQTISDWPENQIDGIHLASTRTGAFQIEDQVGDIAFIADLAPGRYSVHLRPANSQPGVGLVEAYDIDPNSPDTGRFLNISTRGYVGEGDGIMIAGFVIPAGPDRPALVRGVGPELANHDVSGFLADPKIAVARQAFGGDPVTIAENDDWSGAQVAEAALSVNAFPLSPNSKDAALRLTLSPGVYSILLSGVNGATGVGLVEVYELPE